MGLRVISFAFGTPPQVHTGCSGGQVQALGPAAEFVLDEPVFQAVEGDHAQPPAGGQTAEDGVQPFVQGVQL